jgi:hypothetical protein
VRKLLSLLVLLALASPASAASYLKGIGLSTVPELTLWAKPAVDATRLKIYVDYSQYRDGWMPRTRAYIGEINAAKDERVQLPLTSSARIPNGGENTLWWGSPLAFHPVTDFEFNPLVPAVLVRARIAIVGPTGAEQHHYFLLVRSAEIGGRIGIISAGDADGWVGNWEGSAN